MGRLYNRFYGTSSSLSISQLTDFFEIDEVKKKNHHRFRFLPLRVFKDSDAASVFEICTGNGDSQPAEKMWTQVRDPCAVAARLVTCYLHAKFIILAQSTTVDLLSASAVYVQPKKKKSGAAEGAQDVLLMAQRV